MNAPAWSYTILTAFETCPRRYYLTRVSKEVKEPQSEHTVYGNEVHKAFENRLKNKTLLPEHLAKHEGLCAKLETTPGQLFVEEKITLNAQLKPTSWFAKDAWCRGIIDVCVDSGANVAVLDWKTGKPKPESEQLKLFAALIFETRLYVEKVSTGFVWLAHGKMDKEVFTREQLPELWQEFLPRVRRLELAYQDDKWEAKPSGLCREWCPVGKALCVHCGKK